MNKFEQELTGVKAKVMEMGALTERMVAWASNALISRDRAVVAEVLAAEEKLDRFQLEIERSDPPHHHLHADRQGFAVPVDGGAHQH